MKIEFDQEYWYIDDRGEIRKDVNRCQRVDVWRRKTKNVFLSERDAENEFDRIWSSNT